MLLKIGVLLKGVRVTVGVIFFRMEQIFLDGVIIDHKRKETCKSCLAECLTVSCNPVDLAGISEVGNFRPPITLSCTWNKELFILYQHILYIYFRHFQYYTKTNKDCVPESIVQNTCSNTVITTAARQTLFLS